MTISLNGRTLPASAANPPYPKTDRQAEFIALGDRMAEVAAAQADAHDRENSFPHDTFDALRDAGYLALTVPEEFGGRGATPLELMLAQERLARGSGGVALGATMHLSIVGGLAENRLWPSDLFARFSREVVAKGALINSAASEPDLGSPSRGGAFSTRARVDAGRLADQWPQKLDNPLAPAQLRDHPADDRRGRRFGRAWTHARAILDSPGVTVDFGTWDNLSMRASGSNDVIFEDVLIPLENRLPGAPALAQANASGWSLITSAVYLGIATAARDFAVQYAQERVPSGLGKPIAELQNIQHRIAQIEILLLQARSMLYSTIETFEQYPEHRAAIAWQFAATKYTVTNNAIQITDLALRVTGSPGLLKKYPLERYFRDARAGLGNPPMDDVALTLIGKHALGL